MPLLKLMNTPENIINDAYLYIKIIYAGVIATVAYNLIASILRALGDSKTPLYFLIISSVLNVILDLVFIINFNMGVAGAAYATIISQAVSAVQGALNVFGSTIIAAYTAASKALQLVMQPAITFGVTMATYCGQNLGAKEYNRIKEGVKACTKISIITSIIAGAVLIFLGKYFVMMFISNPDVEILKYAQQVLDISAIFFIPLGLIFIYRNALQGIGDSFVPMMAGAYELIARAIVAFTLPQYIGFFGICLADPVAWLAASIPLGITYFKRIKHLLKHGTIKV